ncbi:MAG: DUF177 domain-containing protein [Myxococcales bacterium]|nr:DUF177 domain-containing protein [Myxococcales bacterium]
MKIRVDLLTATPTPLHFEEGTSWWQAHMPAGTGLPRELAEPLRVDVAAHSMGLDVYLEGRVQTAFDLECGRCIARYRQPLDETFRLVLEPAGARSPTDPETSKALARDGLCLDDEFETGWYRGHEIGLDAVCLEVISLALPVKPLCREDCAGLCARCGADLNQGACGCEQIAQNSPFAVLGALRDEHRRS